MCNFLEGHSAYLVALHLVRMRTEIWHPFLLPGFSGLISVTRILSLNVRYEKERRLFSKITHLRYSFFNAQIEHIV